MVRMNRLVLLGSSFEQEIPLKKTTESAKIESEKTKEGKMAKYISVADAAEVLKEKLDEEKAKEIVDSLEEKADEEKKSEDEDETKEEKKKSQDKCGKDEDEEKSESEKKTEDSIKELMSVVKDMADDVKKLVATKTQDEEEKEKESEDEDESESEKKDTEDEDEDEKKESEDSAIFVFGADSAIGQDEALTEYLK